MGKFDFLNSWLPMPERISRIAERFTQAAAHGVSGLSEMVDWLRLILEKSGVTSKHPAYDLIFGESQQILAKIMTRFPQSALDPSFIKKMVLSEIVELLDEEIGLCEKSETPAESTVQAFRTVRSTLISIRDGKTQNSEKRHA